MDTQGYDGSGDGKHLGESLQPHNLAWFSKLKHHQKEKWAAHKTQGPVCFRHDSVCFQCYPHNLLKEGLIYRFTKPFEGSKLPKHQLETELSSYQGGHHHHHHHHTHPTHPNTSKPQCQVMIRPNVLDMLDLVIPWMLLLHWILLHGQCWRQATANTVSSHAND